MKIKTVGDLRNLISELSDDYKIEIRIRKDLDMATVVKSGYPYPFKTYYDGDLVFDDVGVSDKELCIGIEIPQDF